MTEKQATDLYMSRVLAAFSEYYAADSLSIVDQRQAERDAVVAYLRAQPTCCTPDELADAIELLEHLMTVNP